MALVLQDRVKETTTTTGTGTFTLDGTSTGFVGFGVIGNGNETYYTAVDNTTGEWEVGIGTYNAGTLTRDTVLASSNSGNKVPFVAGSKDVFVAYPAEKAVTLDTAQTLANKTLSNANLGTPTAGVLTNATGLPLSTGVTGTLPVGNGGTGATTLTGYVKASGTSAFTAVAAIPGADVSGNISGNAANVTGVVAIANGGTAVTSAPANGQVLIGNGTGYTLATLTAGTGVTITNAPGSITINAPEVGTVTAVTATAPLASSGGNTPDISLTGTVGVSNGGTGATTLTGYVKASGTAAFTAVAQIPNTDISGLGTMSTQNANNVAITGGAIDGTTVGLSTPSSGAFTTLTASGASITSINSGVALLTTATITNLTATSASIASANVGTAVVTTGSVGNLTVTGASIASANVGVALVTTGTVNNLTATGASVASANLGVAVITTGTVGNLTATSASVASANAAVALITTGTVTNLTATSASIASANVATAVVTGLTVTNASIASANAGTATITTGNLTFSSTGQRITGDMSNATHANRLSFQTSTTNGSTTPFLLPNGTGPTSALVMANASDPTNCSYLQVQAATISTNIVSGILGTGTYLPMSFSTGGSERMRLDTSGNLGIGTASPGTKLHLAGAGTTSNAYTNGDAAGATLYLQDTGGGAGNGGQILFGASQGIFSGIKGFLINGTGPAGGLLFQTRTTSGNVDERMRIDSSGNVGIGTTSPGYKLQVNGFVGVTDGTSTIRLANSGGVGLISTITNHPLAFQTNDVERIRIRAGGDVGVGTVGGDTVRMWIRTKDTADSNFGIYIDNTTPTILFFVRNDGLFRTGTATFSPYNYTTGSAANVFVNTDGDLQRSTSSLRYKSDVVDATHGLADVLKLRSVTYKGKNDSETVFGGLIAEEVHNAGLTEFVAYDKEGRPDALHYGNMVALLVKAVQEQQDQIKALQDKIAALEAE